MPRGMPIGRGRDAYKDAERDAYRKGGRMSIWMSIEEGGMPIGREGMGMPIRMLIGRRRDVYRDAYRHGGGMPKGDAYRKGEGCL